MTTRKWTHPSVVLVAKEGNPEEVIVNRARKIVLDSIQDGWTGPPFDPFSLADMLSISVRANSDILDARLIPVERSNPIIEYNPNRSRARISYSIAHEIAHTLFEDFQSEVQHRHHRTDMKGDTWQLEMLCNLAAAEILMPIGGFPEFETHECTIDQVLRLRKEFEVSSEAILLRLVRLTRVPIGVFCASRVEDDELGGKLKLDYFVKSLAFKGCSENLETLPSDSLVKNCTAIGFTEKGVEKWSPHWPQFRIECVGIPPYLGHTFPRVVGLVQPLGTQPESFRGIKYIRGNAMEPRGTGKKYIVQIVNDKARSWGGSFGKALKTRWPHALSEFKSWRIENPKAFKLGAVHTSKVENELWIASLVAQIGYGASDHTRVQYSVLRECLDSLRKTCLDQKASVHMPRIGCGAGGAQWSVVGELVEECVSRHGVVVTVYDFPDPVVDPPELGHSSRKVTQRESSK